MSPAEFKRRGAPGEVRDGVAVMMCGGRVIRSRREVGVEVSVTVGTVV